jgi:hypothetical protein
MLKKDISYHFTIHYDTNFLPLSIYICHGVGPLVDLFHHGISNIVVLSEDGQVG